MLKTGHVRATSGAVWADAPTISGLSSGGAVSAVSTTSEEAAEYSFDQREPTKKDIIKMNP